MFLFGVFLLLGLYCNRVSSWCTLGWWYPRLPLVDVNLPSLVVFITTGVIVGDMVSQIFLHLFRTVFQSSIVSCFFPQIHNK